MLTSPSTRGAHRFFISTGRLRNVHWQVQRAALTAFVSVHIPAHTHTGKLDDNNAELDHLRLTCRLFGHRYVCSHVPLRLTGLCPNPGDYDLHLWPA